MEKTLFLAIVIGLCSSFICAGSPKVEVDNAAWPRWRGSNGDGISLETDWDSAALSGGANILWRVKIGSGYSNVALDSDRLYAMGGAYLYCLNAQTGEEIWNYQFDKASPPQTTPTFDRGYVYGLSDRGVVVCLKAKTGKLQWKKDLREEYSVYGSQYGYAGSPVVAGDLLILGVNPSAMALDKKTGEKVWAYDSADSSVDIYATPLVYEKDGQQYALISNDRGLFSLHCQTGMHLWSYEEQFPYTAPDPVLFDNRVMISTYAECILLDIAGETPKVLWRNENLKNHFSSSVYLDGYIYGSDGYTGKRTSFRCVDVRSGDLKWEQEMGVVSLIASDGRLIILEEDGTLRIATATHLSYQELYSVDALGGDPVFRRFYTPPVLYKGRIYCRDYTGELVCIDVRK
jgi:outer membrane protein assembly factor BamB